MRVRVRVRILYLVVEVAVEITPDGNIVDIRGKNGAGKSAILDAIFTTLTGTRLEEPIRRGSAAPGEERAEVVVDLGDCIVKKTWTPKGEYLKIEGLPKGETPQGFLNKLIGKLSFDPLAFLKMKPTEQRDLLKTLVGLDFTDLDAEKAKVYADRNVTNSKIKDVIAQNRHVEPPHPSTPDEEISYKERIENLNQLREKREAFEKAIAKRDQLDQDVRSFNDEITEKEEQIIALQRQIKEIKTLIEEHQEIIRGVVIPPEVTQQQIFEAQEEITKIEDQNVLIRAAKRYRENIKAAERLQKESDKHSQALERLEQDKATRIANAAFPLPGLAMSDDSVTYEGLPFSRQSTGKQIRVSTAIAMKLNPTLKVIFIREGSLLDEAGLKEIADLAKDQDYQVFIESVDSEGNAGIYIEDGSITKINGKEVEQPQPEEAKV